MNKEQALAAFGNLLDIMDELREKCPWDKEQTLESIRHLTIEETYELSDAILSKDMDEIRKEIGDILLHVVFYSRIGSETGHFDITSVIEGLTKKLIDRHPHIYGDFIADDSSAVKQNWEKIKMNENGAKRKSVLEGVPKSMPALVKAYRIQEKVAQVGFDWKDMKPVVDKVHEELAEMELETDILKKSDEFGDLMFALVNFARHSGINPDDALENTNRKFVSRFSFMEDKAQKSGLNLHEMTLEEMDVWWVEAKANERIKD